MAENGADNGNPTSPGNSTPTELDLTFEQAYAELEKTVNALQQGQLSLDETLRLYERGSHLARFCRETLDAVELKVTQLLSHANGTFSTKPIVSEKDIVALDAPAPSAPTVQPAPTRPAPARQDDEPNDEFLRGQRELFD